MFITCIDKNSILHHHETFMKTSAKLEACDDDWHTGMIYTSLAGATGCEALFLAFSLL
jgi:hypothetical protein